MCAVRVSAEHTKAVVHQLRVHAVHPPPDRSLQALADEYNETQRDLWAAGTSIVMQHVADPPPAPDRSSHWKFVRQAYKNLDKPEGVKPVRHCNIWLALAQLLWSQMNVCK